MPNLVFVLSLAVVFSVLFAWAFRHLPGDRWQFIAAVPLRKNGDGTWHGINLTYYGFFNANAYLAAVVTVFVLLGAVGVPAAGILVFTFALLTVCVPASRLVARLVEKKRFTFSVAGAAFIGLLVSPWLAWVVDLTLGPRLGFRLPVTAAVAAISVAYAVGEGLGRLACISFGCCYGKPVAGLPPLIRRLLLGPGFTFTFEGKTKKIAYADHMDGQKVAPVQALTAVLFTAVGLVGMHCYLEGHFLSAFLIPLFTTQAWRFVSEFLRADYRGRGGVTAYQKICLAAMLYACIVAGAALVPLPSGPPNLAAGLASLWRPSLILFLQGLWVFSFLYTGKSQVTDAHLRFGVRRDRI